MMIHEPDALPLRQLLGLSRKLKMRSLQARSLHTDRTARDWLVLLTVLKKVRRAIKTNAKISTTAAHPPSNNAAPHHAMEVPESLNAWRCEGLYPLPFTPTLLTGPLTMRLPFFLLPQVKDCLRGQRFPSEDEANEAF